MESFIIESSIKANRGMVGVFISARMRLGTSLVSIALLLGLALPVFATTEPSVLATLTAGNAPRFNAVSPDGTRLYVSNTLSASVTIFDTESRAEIGTISLPANPYQLAISPDGTSLYVGRFDTFGTGSLWIVNLLASPPSIVRTVDIGAGARGIAVTRNGQKVYVANGNSGTVSVVSTLDNSVETLGPFSVGGQSLTTPAEIVMSPDGQFAYVSFSRRTDSGFPGMARIRLSDNTAELIVGSVGYQPSGLALSSNGRNLYIADPAAANNAVRKYDLVTASGDWLGSAVSTIDGSSTYFISLSADDSTIFLAPNGGTTLKIADTTSGAVTSSITLPKSLEQVTAIPSLDARYAFVGSRGGSPVSTAVYVIGTEAAAPGTPGAPSVVAGDAKVTVTPVAGGGGAAESYLVTANTGETCTVTAPAVSCDVVGLTNGVAYTFTVTATNSSGTSAASDPSESVTPTAGLDDPCVVELGSPFEATDPAVDEEPTEPEETQDPGESSTPEAPETGDTPETGETGGSQLPEETEATGVSVAFVNVGYVTPLNVPDDCDESGGGAGASSDVELPAYPRIALDFRGRVGQSSEGAIVGVSGLSVPDGAIATVTLFAPEVKLFEQVLNPRAFEGSVVLPAGLTPGSYTVVYQVVLPSGEVLALHVVVGIGDGGVITSVSENVVGSGPAGLPAAKTELSYTGVRSSSLPWWAIITIFGGLFLIVYSRRAVKMAEAFEERLDENSHRTPWEILSTPIRVPGIEYIPGDADVGYSQSLGEAVRGLDVAFSLLIASQIARLRTQV